MSELMKKVLEEIEEMYFAGAALDVAIKNVKKKYNGYLNWRDEANGE